MFLHWNEKIHQILTKHQIQNSKEQKNTTEQWRKLGCYFRESCYWKSVVLYLRNYIKHKHPDVSDDAFKQIKKNLTTKKTSFTQKLKNGKRSKSITRVFYGRKMWCFSIRLHSICECTSVSCHSQTPLNLSETIYFNCLFGRFLLVLLPLYFPFSTVCLPACERGECVHLAPKHKHMLIQRNATLQTMSNLWL